MHHEAWQTSLRSIVAFSHPSALVPTWQAVGLCDCGHRLEPYGVSPHLSNAAINSHSWCHQILHCPPLFGKWHTLYTAGSKEQKSPLLLEQRVKQDPAALIYFSLQDHTHDAMQLPLGFISTSPLPPPGIWACLTQQHANTAHT